MGYHPEQLSKLTRPKAMPFRIGKLGHVVLNVSDLDRSVTFYTQVLGFEISDLYPPAMMPAAWCSCASMRITMASRWSARCGPVAEYRAQPRRLRGRDLGRGDSGARPSAQA
ncbi:MAG: VOC family protein [Pseudomonadota bacterium]